MQVGVAAGAALIPIAPVAAGAAVIGAATVALAASMVRESPADARLREEDAALVSTHDIPRLTGQHAKLDARVRELEGQLKAHVAATRKFPFLSEIAEAIARGHLTDAEVADPEFGEVLHRTFRDLMDALDPRTAAPYARLASLYPPPNVMNRAGRAIADLLKNVERSEWPVLQAMAKMIRASAPERPIQQPAAAAPCIVLALRRDIRWQQWLVVVERDHGGNSNEALPHDESDRLLRLFAQTGVGRAQERHSSNPFAVELREDEADAVAFVLVGGAQKPAAPR